MEACDGNLQTEAERLDPNEYSKVCKYRSYFLILDKYFFRVVMTETKKAFRTLEKRNDLESAILNLSNLKVKNYKLKNYSFKNNFSNFL